MNPGLTLAASDQEDSSTSNRSSLSMEVPAMCISTLSENSSSNSKGSSIEYITEKLDLLHTNDLELMLSMETQARIDAQEERERNAAEMAAREAITPPRPSRLKFKIPVTPPRSRSPAAATTYPRARPVRIIPEEPVAEEKKKRRGRWSIIMGSDQDSSSEEEEDDDRLKIGSRVILVRRPLPTIGYVRYIGPFDPEYGVERVGVELESRVGNSDGSVNGKRYFQTDPHRGIFLKKNEIAIV
ncbi:CAP Gly-rich domain-containing protein [Spinellus fusiger]|nr:CAP Gly-rich domain-containing protein [Spinellus fusiger]